MLSCKRGCCAAAARLLRGCCAASRGGGREQFACDCMGSLVCYLLLSERVKQREERERERRRWCCLPGETSRFFPFTISVSGDMCFVCLWRRTAAGGGYFLHVCDPKAANSSAAADTSFDSLCKFHWSFVCMRVESKSKRERDSSMWLIPSPLYSSRREPKPLGFPMHPFFISSNSQSANANPFVRRTDEFHTLYFSRQFCCPTILVVL